MDTSNSSPSDIVIIGAGVFGLSTARALLQRPKYANTTITILDAAPELPNTSSASADTSRILRADYALKPYTKLVSDAQKLWKDLNSDGWGGQGRYHDAKIVVTDQPGTEGHVDGYLKESLNNIKVLAATGNYSFKPNHLRELRDQEAIKQETGLPGVSGNAGYVNDNCGWVNASACVKFVFESLQRAGDGRVKFRPNSRVRRLLYKSSTSSQDNSHRCCGVELEDGSHVRADFVILAAGAWSPSLVDLRGQAMATGQVLAYLSLSEAEQKALDSMPVYFNVSRGMFMIPANNRELKLGRHGFGYQNPTKVSWATGNGQTIHALVSTPRTDLPVPAEAEAVLREFLVELFPKWKKRQFLKTRVCWYCDTPSGDFLIDYHPQSKGLFIATGDSGHAFKVFPVIGEKVVDAIEGNLEKELQELWRWKDNAPTTFDGTDDGTRGGRRGMILEDEWEKGGLLLPLSHL